LPLQRFCTRKFLGLAKELREILNLAITKVSHLKIFRALKRIERKLKFALILPTMLGLIPEVVCSSKFSALTRELREI
jgi:hypothetical protein